MQQPATDAYIAAFGARWEVTADPGMAAHQERVNGPGIRGIYSTAGTAPSQLLVLDDRGVDTLTAVLPLVSAGTIRVCADARRCAALVRDDPRWTAKAVTAMVCSDLSTVPAPALPAGLSLQPVRRSAATEVPEAAAAAASSAGGVSLFDAIMAAARAAPEDVPSVDALVTYLESLPEAAQLLAAVDDHGVVRGTSASRTSAGDAYVFFVNTDHGWRRRGVGLSMTSAALRAAAAAGAHRACLDASGLGVPLYLRLGFAIAVEMTQFSIPT